MNIRFGEDRYHYAAPGNGSGFFDAEKFPHHVWYDVYAGKRERA